MSFLLSLEIKTNNKEIENAKTDEINYFNDKRKALGIKYKNEELADANKSYDEKLALLERQKNDEINSFFRDRKSVV